MQRRSFYITSILISILCLSTLGLLCYNTYKLNIIPNRYLLVGLAICIISILILFIGMISKKVIISRISMVLLVIISLAFIFVTINLNKTYNFISNLVLKYDTLNYSIIVKENSNYQKIENLKDKTIAYYNEYNQIEKELNKKITFNKQELDDSLLYSKLMDNEVDAIILEDGYLKLLEDEIEEFNANTRIIYTFKIKIKAHKEKSTVNLTSEPFILYISGIDMWGNVNSVRGRSDVNQIMVINPNTKHILIANTPRDYYIRLHGTTGLRDKLTHAGIYGINKSIETLEDLYNIDINHYVRVNFDSLVKIVDTIDGINIYSDKTFRPKHLKSWTVQKGMNTMNGKQALAYSRERYAYVDGDHHRGRNQQQVLEAIIDKLSSPSLLVKKYNAILNGLDGSLQTDIDRSMITSFIKYQIDKNPKWTVETMQATGSASWNYTYSMGYNYYLWVMEPNWSSVNNIKNRINEVLLEKVGEE